MVYRKGNKIDSPEESRENGESDNESALIPKSLIAGMDLKAGDEIRLKVTHLFDDEIEVEYVHKEDNEPEDESKKAPEEEGMEEMVADA